MSKCGFVAVVGRPNAGKSSLLNWLVKEKIAMVSHKANATRKRANIFVMHNENQIIFVDTPGLHEKERLLNQFMLQEALKAIGDCDLILFLAPITDTTKNYEEFLELSEGKEHPLLLTKIDNISKDEQLKEIKKYEKFQGIYKELIPVSIKHQNQEYLLEIISKYLPTHPYLYDPEILTTMHLRDIYKELIREALFDNLSNEIPYFTDVIIDKVDESGSLEKIYATIICEKKSHKGMIIGKGGSAIKRISMSARVKIEEFLQERVFLKLGVAIKPGWTKDKDSLKKLGYDF